MRITTVQFYRELVNDYPLETVLKALARIITATRNDKKVTEHYDASKSLFGKTTAVMNLQWRDIAVMTSGASELELYQELKNHEITEDNRQSEN